MMPIRAVNLSPALRLISLFVPTSLSQHHHSAPYFSLSLCSVSLWFSMSVPLFIRLIDTQVNLTQMLRSVTKVSQELLVAGCQSQQETSCEVPVVSFT